MKTLIEEIIVFGAIYSGMLALLAIGYTLIYGVTGVVNMAHGALFMVGAYIFWFLTTTEFPGLPYEPIALDLTLALIVAVILTGIIGAVIYRLVIHSIVEDMAAVLIATVGVLVIIQELIIAKWPLGFGSEFWHVPSLVEGFTFLWDVKVTYSQLLAFVVSLCLFAGLWIFIARTKIGKAMRAVSQDREMAMLVGINTERLYMLTMGISSAFAAMAGILITASTTGFAYPYMWERPLLMSFAIVILGGLGSIKGTLVGAFIIGFAENAFIFVLVELGWGGVEFLRGVVAMVAMVVVLLIRPKGLFGKRVEMEE